MCQKSEQNKKCTLCQKIWSKKNMFKDYLYSHRIRANINYAKKLLCCVPCFFEHFSQLQVTIIFNYYLCFGVNQNTVVK